MRFWAMILRPASSITAFTLPVRFRRVASGLIIEKVRSVAIAASLGFRYGRLSKGLRGEGQGGMILAPPKYYCFRQVSFPSRHGQAMTGRGLAYCWASPL